MQQGAINCAANCMDDFALVAALNLAICAASLPPNQALRSLRLDPGVRRLLVPASHGGASRRHVCSCRDSSNNCRKFPMLRLAALITWLQVAASLVLAMTHYVAPRPQRRGRVLGSRVSASTPGPARHPRLLLAATTHASGRRNRGSIE